MKKTTIRSLSSGVLYVFAFVLGFCCIYFMVFRPVYSYIIYPSFFEETDIEPTIEELIEHGFYIYILPKTETSELPKLYIYSWTRHCVGPSSAVNPVRVSYQQPDIHLVVGPRSDALNRNDPSKKVEIANPWFANTAFLYDHGKLLLSDNFGNPIRVDSRTLSDREIIHFVNKLEYVGPPPENIGYWGADSCSS